VIRQRADENLNLKMREAARQMPGGLAFDEPYSGALTCS
jgi:hypothetical protein